MTRTITVKGTGSVSAKPDYIILTLSISAEDMAYERAMEEAARRIGLLEEAAVQAGFAKSDLKTTSFNVNTQYETITDPQGGFRRQFTGYVCAYRLKLAFDLTAGRLAAVLSAIAGSGAKAELHIAFTVKDPAKVREELLASAAANAREKAAVLCRASGVELGELLRINYDWSELRLVSQTRYAMEDCVMPMMAAAKTCAPEIEPDDIDLSDTACFVWEIE